MSGVSIVRAMLVPCALLAALGVLAEGRVSRASYLSNKRDVDDWCEEYDDAVSSGAPCEEGALWAHPEDCRLFYQCAAGAGVCRRCPAGLHYNSARNVCDHPSRAGCVSPVSPEDRPSHSIDDMPPLCKNNSITPVSCADAVTLDALLPHPDDCRLFYYCVNPDSEPVCRQCPADLHFNPEKYVCDRPEDAGCQVGNGIDALSTFPLKEKDVSVGADIVLISTFPSKEQPAGDIPTRCIENSVSSVSCADVNVGADGDGLLPHPDDCELFYACADAGSPPVCRQCPAHLHFNPVLHVCDNAKDAGCHITKTKIFH